MPDPRPCCILGVCCDPGGDAQRADLRAWLLAKLEAYDVDLETPGFSRKDAEKAVDSWLDELYADATK